MLYLWGKATRITPILGLCCLFWYSTQVEASDNFTSVKTETKDRENILDRYFSLKRRDDMPKTEKSWSRSLSISQNNSRFFISQVNSIEQLEDVKPTDWSYEALRSLIERYGCINEFSNQTYRGTENLSRTEFAAGLNSCLNQIEAILTNSDRMSQEDVDTVLRLMQEFQSDLAILQGRIDGTQARIEDLEAIKFSTTTKLQGEAVLGLGDVLSGNDETSNIFGSRLRLDFKTSFSGNDLLFTRLSRNDFLGFAEEIDTVQGNLSFADSETEDLEVEELSYSFGVIDSLDLIVGATGVDADDIASTINVLDGDGGSGSISTFGTRNPIYNPSGDAGLGVVHRPINRVEISAGYLASPAEQPNAGSGLFNGPYSALGQIKISPFDSLSMAATYVHSYNQSNTGTGTNNANLRSQTAVTLGEEVPTVSNSYGLELSWAISGRIVVGGWGGLSKVSNLSTLDRQLDRGTQDIWNWAATLAFPDLGREGSMAGILVGSEPKVTNSTIDNLAADRDRSLHLEAFYQYQISDNIAVTPGVIWITEPDSNIQDSEDLVIGTVRTTFSF